MAKESMQLHIVKYIPHQLKKRKACTTRSRSQGRNIYIKYIVVKSDQLQSWSSMNDNPSC